MSSERNCEALPKLISGTKFRRTAVCAALASVARNKRPRLAAAPVGIPAVYVTFDLAWLAWLAIGRINPI